MNQIIKHKILTIRGKQVILDRDLADLYEVETGNLNKSVKRNIERFPEDFCFRLTDDEFDNLVFQNGISNRGGTRFNPYVFTEQGVATLSGILKSKKAIEINIIIMRAFVEMRKFLTENANYFQKFQQIDQKLIEHDTSLNKIFKTIENKNMKSQGIFYNGQIFDAYKFITDLIKQANKEIILIDNYIDETTLTILSKTEVKTTIYTKTITNQLKLDIKKFKEQYHSIEIKTTNDFHDRFLIIDEITYHIGASIKDLGKKIFAFSKLDINILKLLK